MFGIFIQGKKEAEQYADGEKNAGNPVPAQFFAVVQILDNPHCNKREADAVGQSGQQLRGCADQHFPGISPAPQMKEEIEQGGKNKCNLFLNGFHLMLAELAYIFPDTRPKDDMLFPVVQLFRQTVHLAPVENDLPAPLPPLAEELLAQGLLRFHCPAPLGKDRERFLSMVRELRQRPADYAGLALSGFGASQAAESKSAIISAIRQARSGTTESKAEQERAAALWQARLVLKLGELVEQEEAEIRQSLRRVTLREQELLEALRDEHPAASPSPDWDRPHESRRSRLLLKAWQKLLAASSGPLLSNLFITADHDAFAALIEESSAEARQTLTLSLPARPAGEDVAGGWEKFRQAAAEMINDMPISFKQEAWENLLERHYPKAVHGRCRLTLHLDQSCPSIDRETVLGILEPA